MTEYVKMTGEHISQVAALERICFQDPWSERSISGELDNPLSVWFVCVEDGKVLGYVGSQTVMGESDMMNIAVNPDARRRGIARGLIAALVAELRNEGSHCLSLEVRASNTPAINLYQSLSFQQAGRRLNYYRNPKEDALILRKEWEV